MSSLRCKLDENGNSEKDWEIFDILCGDTAHPLDLATTLRSELAASAYKLDRLQTELTEAKSSLCAKESECETLRAQTARQSALIASLQTRLQSAEQRERNLQARFETSSSTFHREKRNFEEKSKKMCDDMHRLEYELSTEEGHLEQAKTQLKELIRRLCICLGIDVCDSTHLTAECVVSKANDTVSELQRLRTKMATTSESLQNCETELLNLRSTSSNDKQRLQHQLDTLQPIASDLENRTRQSERDLQITKDRLAESEVNAEKLREELRGFESRCCRLQNTLDRIQSDRLQFLRNVALMITVPEPCETLIKDKLRELLNENQSLQTQIVNLRDRISTDTTKHRETIETTTNRLRTEEMQKCSIEESLEKANRELETMKDEHTTLGDFLVRLSRALCWSECTNPPIHGNDTTILAESLLERAERLTAHHDHHLHGPHHLDHLHSYSHHNHHHHTNPLPHGHHHHHHHHQHNSLKLRRERSCHDLPLKESSAMYMLQRRVRVLREQVQRRDLHLELLKRKLALLEDGNRNKCIIQHERDDAVNRARRSAKQNEKSNQQLAEMKAQLCELKSQLTQAADFKLTALERARKIDELHTCIRDIENERTRLLNEIENHKTRARCAVDSSHERSHRDENIIKHLREDIGRLKIQLSETQHKLSQLQTFRTSVARLLHLRDIPHSSLLQRLQTLCNAHQEFTLLSRRYESASPIGDHPCPRYDDLIPPTTQCRPLSSSPAHIRRFEDSGLDDHFDDDFDYTKKY